MGVLGERMRNTTFLFLLFLFQPSAEARAQESPVLVELFTSQACSACPAIDEAFGALARRADVVALTFHVDYWDYLGWKDEFAKEAHTRRQRAYARANGRRTIYTPQLLVDGHPLPTGSDLRDLERFLASQSEARRRVELEVNRAGQVVDVALAPAGPGVGPADVHVALFEPALTSEIGGGDNAGLRVTYYNVVTDWRTVGRWNGREAAEMRINIPSGRQGVVIVQSEGAGLVLAAQRLR